MSSPKLLKIGPQKIYVWKDNKQPHLRIYNLSKDYFKRRSYSGFIGDDLQKGHVHKTRNRVLVLTDVSMNVDEAKGVCKDRNT